MKTSSNHFRFSLSLQNGQAMLLTVLALGGSILGATTIAGLLMLYQIRQTTDLNDSTRAIFAADAGVEWGLFQLLNPGQGSALSFPPGTSATLTCYDASKNSVSCSDERATSLHAVGKSGSVSRAFELNF